MMWPQCPLVALLCPHVARNRQLEIFIALCTRVVPCWNEYRALTCRPDLTPSPFPVRCVDATPVICRICPVFCMDWPAGTRLLMLSGGRCQTSFLLPPAPAEEHGRLPEACPVCYIENPNCKLLPTLTCDWPQRRL